MTQPKLDLQALLTHLPLFRNLAPEQLTLMAGAAREARVQKNAYLLGHDGLIAAAGPEIRLLDPEGLERRLFTS